jgi:hypothetical protein
VKGYDSGLLSDRPTTRQLSLTTEEKHEECLVSRRFISHTVHRASCKTSWSSSGHQDIQHDDGTISKHDTTASFHILPHSLVTNHPTFRRYEVSGCKDTDTWQAPHTRVTSSRHRTHVSHAAGSYESFVNIYQTTRRHITKIVSSCFFNVI